MTYFFKFLLIMLVSLNSLGELPFKFYEDVPCHNSPEMRYENDLIYKKDGTEPYSGDVICIQSRGQFKNGKKHGEWTNWNGKGQKSSMLRFKNGKVIAGLNIDYFYHNSQISNLFTFKGEEFDYLNNRNGRQVSFYENGNLRYETNITNGMANGKWTWWHEDGKIAYKLNYKNDKLDGLQKKWNENGILIYEANFKEGHCLSGSCLKEDLK